jgi:FtsH-binding integral membrane protein
MYCINYIGVTKSDFTGYGPFLFIFTIVLIAFGIICIFWQNEIAQLIYASLAALLFSIYLIFDTQMILGRFQLRYSLDDAYFAAIMLYIDIMQIFLQVLRILVLVQGRR